MELTAQLDPARVAPLDAQAVSVVFGFTPAEARVVVLMAQGQTATSMADQLAVLPFTVRTYVRQVLAKMGVQRKVDAVRLLA